jgi:hypothetical protein
LRDANSTNVTSIISCSSVKIYGFKVYERGVLARDFTPCLEAGVYRDFARGGRERSSRTTA